MKNHLLLALKSDDSNIQVKHMILILYNRDTQHIKSGEL